MFLSLGEIMLRFCPGDHPLRAATQFTFSEGGGEYNVARGVSRCFGIPASIATALVDNELGHLVHQLIRSSEIDTSNILWREFDGIGKQVRNPLYFAERGFGHRPPKACMDRGHSAPSQLTTTDFDWDAIFSSGNISWFHTGGIFAGLSESTAEVAQQAMTTARKHGVHVSYDPNFRGSLWQDRGGPQAAAKLNSTLAHHCDTLFGVAPILTHTAPPQDLTELENLIQQTATAFPQLQQIALGRRHIRSASDHDYAATIWDQGTITHIDGFTNIHVLDRIGSGDAFAAGYISHMLDSRNTPSPQTAILQGAAASALTMSTPGDAVLCSAQDVYQLMNAKHSQESR
ncbi:MAG: sugar kinase [Akkermansiaceae bacterium]